METKWEMTSLITADEIAPPMPMPSYIICLAVLLVLLILLACCAVVFVLRIISS
jgi:hypothetical protein